MRQNDRSFDKPLKALIASARLHEFDVAFELQECEQFDARLNMEKRINLSGDKLAKALIEKLVERIINLAKGEVLVLRLDRVTVNTSFAFAVVHDLVCDRQKPRNCQLKEKALLMVNPDKATKLAVHYALTAKKDSCMILDAPKSGLTSPSTLEDWRLWYAGNLQPHRETVIAFVHERGEATSKDLVESFKFDLADASYRLRTLYEDGFLQRKPTVREDDHSRSRLTYTYRWFHPVLEGRPDLNPNQLSYQILSREIANNPTLLFP